MDDTYLYHYNAKVISVYDGDTCTVDIDLGLEFGHVMRKFVSTGSMLPEFADLRKWKGKNREIICAD